MVSVILEVWIYIFCLTMWGTINKNTIRKIASFEHIRSFILILFVVNSVACQTTSIFIKCKVREGLPFNANCNPSQIPSPAPVSIVITRAKHISIVEPSDSIAAFFWIFSDNTLIRCLNTENTYLTNIAWRKHDSSF